MRAGRFITLEVIEGAGKTSNVELIKALLEDAGRTVMVTREPGGTKLGEHIRELLLNNRASPCADSEVLLMFAARAEHLHKVIRPALSAGKTVLCDRFTDATYAYKGGGQGIPDERIAVLENWVQAELRPDLTLLFDVPVEIGLRRAGKRSTPDRFEREKNHFFERVRAHYLAAAALEPQRIRVIDAAASPEEVEQQIRAILRTVAL